MNNMYYETDIATARKPITIEDIEEGAKILRDIPRVNDDEIQRLILIERSIKALDYIEKILKEKNDNVDLRKIKNILRGNDEDE